MIRHSRTIKCEGPVTTLAVSPDGSQLAAASVKAIELFETSSGDRFGRIQNDRVLTGVALAPNSRWVAVAADDPTVLIHDSASERSIRKLSRDTVPDFLRKQRQRQVAFFPDGKTLLTRAENTDVTIWDGASGKWEHLYQMPHNGFVVMSPDGKHLAVLSKPNPRAYRGQVTMYRLEAGLHELWARKHDSDAGIIAGAFSPDGTRLISLNIDDGMRIWNVSSGEQIAHIPKDNSSSVMGVMFVEDEQHLLMIASRSLELRRLGQPDSLATVTTPQPNDILGYSYSTRGTLMATFNATSAVDIWKIDPKPRNRD